MIKWTDADPSLTYRFNQFFIEFIRDEVFITDLQYRRKYRLACNGERDFPFQFILLEKE